MQRPPSPPSSPHFSGNLPLAANDDNTSIGAFTSYGVMTLVAFSLLIWCAAVPHSCTTTHATTRFQVSSSVMLSFAFLVVVAIAKTVLTKHIFEHFHAPVAMSALSCIVTALLLCPITVYTRQCRMLRVSEIVTFFMVCVAVAADLAFTNIGLSILPLAFQQSIKSTLPIATIALDFFINQARVSMRTISVVVGICIGPVIMSMDKDWSEDGNLFYGVVMLSLSIVAGALKYVLAHSAIKKYKTEMGVMGFTVWMEVIALVLLVPWSVVRGEVQYVLTSSSNWGLLVGTGAFGGVRILSQFYFLDNTSATSLAASNIVIQVGLTLSGSLFFHDPVTLPMVSGSIVTLVMSASYMYLKATDSREHRSTNNKIGEQEIESQQLKKNYTLVSES